MPKTQDSEVLDGIAILLNATEWDSDTMSLIAKLVSGTGRTINDIDTDTYLSEES